MSKNTSKALIDLIDSRIATKRYQRVAVVESVSEDGKTATVSFPGTDMVVDVNIKTPEKFEAGDSVTIASIDGDLMNGYIQTRFGESSWLSVGNGIEVEPGAIDEDALAPGAVTGGKIADFSVENAHIVNAAITNAKIENAAITNAKIENLAVTTAKIQDAAITNAKIENLAVDNAKIAIAAIDTANIKNAAITTACIGDAAIKTTQIADGSVTDAKIVGLTANKITAGTIDAGTITVVNLDAANITVGKINGVQIEDGAIGIAKLDAIVNDKIATAQATADGKNTIFYHGEAPVSDDVKLNDTWFDIDDGYKMYTYDGTVWVATQFGTSAINDSAITSGKIANASIIEGKLAVSAVTNEKIAIAAITTEKITDSAITADKIISGAITGVKLSDGAVTAQKIAANTITTNEIAAGAITADEIAANAITSVKIVADAITTNKIAADSITSSKIVADGITTREIATGAIVADKLAVGSVTSNAIETKAITAIHIDTNTITADKLLLGDNTNFSTVWLSQYTTEDWASWTGMTFPTALKDVNDYVYPSLTTNTDFLFSMPFDATALTTVTAENSFGFKFTTNNSAASNKTALLSVYFFGSAKNYLSKTTLDTLTLTASTVQDWNLIKTVAKNTSAKYFCFGVNITGGFTGMFKNVQIRRSVGSTFISDGSITTTKIVTDAITSDKIAARSILATKIAANAITAEEIAAGAITADEIAANAITASKIKAGEITTSHVNSAFGQSLNLSSNTSITITAAQIALAGGVTFTNLSTQGQTAINGANITTGTISASRLDLSGYATFTSLSTAGSTTINGANITTGTITASRINLNGYSGSNFSITSSGVINIPNSSPINFGSYGSKIYSYGAGISIVGVSGDILMETNPGYYTKVGYLYANSQPYNVPLTSPSASEKINKIHWKNSTFVNVTLASGAEKGITVWESDKKWKTNISDSEIDALKTIEKIKPRSFIWKKTGIYEDCGFIAQEIEETIGEKHVLKIPQENGDINYQLLEKGFIPLLVKGVQELNAQLTESKNEIHLLKSKMNSYDQTIQEMKLEIKKLKNLLT